MLATGILPDFITVDGAEGGTGAAPSEFSDYVGLALDEALPFVHSSLVGCNLRQHIRLIASGKIVDGFDMMHKIKIIVGTMKTKLVSRTPRRLRMVKVARIKRQIANV